MRNWVFLISLFCSASVVGQSALKFEPGGKFDFLPKRLFISGEIDKNPTQFPIWHQQALSNVEFDRRASYKLYYKDIQQKDLNAVNQNRILSEFTYKETQKWKPFHNRSMFASWSNGRSGFYLNPVLDLSLGLEPNAPDGEFLMWNGRGAEVGITIGNSIYAYARVEEIQTYALPFIEELYEDQYKVFPGQGRTKLFKERGYDFSRTESLIAFSPIKEIQVRMGTGKHHWGNGIRSLWISESGHNYPYVQLQTQLGPVTYTNLFTEFVHYQAKNASDQPVEKKFGAFHQLEVQLTKHWDFSVFEGVIHTPSANSGMYLGYLNPLMFYRTYEYHMGSADNVVIGAQSSVRIKHQALLYGQFLLDEFNLTELRENTGWWANKWATQFGIEIIDLGIANFDLKAEYNTARPFTYSHSSEIGSYSHYAQPLGHALGSNFKEFISSFTYRTGPLTSKLSIMLAKQGRNMGSNTGGNILISNSDFAERYGNETLQGDLNSIQFIKATVSWEVFPEIFLDGNILYRSANLESQGSEPNNQIGVIGGFRWNAQRREIIR